MAKLRKCRLGKLCFLALKYLWLGGTFNRWEPELKISWYLQIKSWKEDRISQPLQSKSQSKFLLIKVGKMLKLHLVKVLVLYEPPLQGDFLGHLHPPGSSWRGIWRTRQKGTQLYEELSSAPLTACTLSLAWALTLWRSPRWWEKRQISSSKQTFNVQLHLMRRNELE